MFDFIGGWQSNGSFINPRVHPTFAGLIVDRVILVPYGVDTTSVDASQNLTDIQPDEGILTVLYRSMKPEEADSSSSSSSRPDELAKIEADYSAEMLTLKGSKWIWNEGAKAGEQLTDSDIQPYKVIPFKQLVITLRDDQQIVEENFNDQIGTVNQDDWAGHDCETLLFMGAKTEKALTTDGLEFNRAVLRFGFKKNRWNRFWDGAQFTEIYNADFTQPTLCGTNCPSKVYDCSDFDDLITQQIPIQP